jgi:hypothetical protein
VLAFISRLYEIERACTDQSVEFRHAQRQEHAAPLLSDLKSWLDDQDFLSKSDIGKAATYTRNQWAALNRYTEDGALNIDNNAAERAMKSVAIGRKNWLFVGSPLAGSRAAVLLSLIASCKRCEAETLALVEIGADRSPRRSLSGISSSRRLADSKPATQMEHRRTQTRRTKEKGRPVDHRTLTQVVCEDSNDSGFTLPFN